MRLSLAVLSAFVAAGCGSAPPTYTAEPATAETVVDGDAREWPAALRPVPQESGLSIGMRLDGDALVVALIAGDDRQARRIAAGGLTVWIDPEGGTDRVLGLTYPAPEAPDAREIAQSRPRGGGMEPDPTRLRRRFESGLDAVVVRRGVVTQRVDPTGGFGVEAAATWGPQTLVVEMRVPLDARPGLLAAGAGETVGLGVELVDVRETMVANRGATRGARPGRPGRIPTDDARADSDRQPEVQTVTRWLTFER